MTEETKGQMVVVQPFSLTKDDGEKVHFQAGIHQDVPDSVRNHWYAKNFISPDGKLPAGGFGASREDQAQIKRVQEEADEKVRQADAAVERLRSELTQANQRFERLTAEHAEVATKSFSAQADITRLTEDNTRLKSDLELSNRELDMLKKRVEELESEDEESEEKPTTAAKTPAKK